MVALLTLCLLALGDGARVHHPAKIAKVPTNGERSRGVATHSSLLEEGHMVSVEGIDQEAKETMMEVKQALNKFRSARDENSLSAVKHLEEAHASTQGIKTKINIQRVFKQQSRSSKPSRLEKRLLKLSKRVGQVLQEVQKQVLQILEKQLPTNQNLLENAKRREDLVRLWMKKDKTRAVSYLRSFKTSCYQLHIKEEVGVTLIKIVRGPLWDEFEPLSKEKILQNVVDMKHFLEARQTEENNSVNSYKPLLS